MNESEIHGYLARIGIEGTAEATAQALRTIQRAHLLVVPFENLDILRRVSLSLSLPDLFDKIVVRRRGGFCYELNGLFAELLRVLGFDVTCLSATDAHEDGTYSPEFDHLTLLVRCRDDAPGAPGWLADVGWGDSFRDPLLMAANVEQEQDGRTFTLRPDGERLLLWMRDVDGYEERQYSFSLQPRRFEEFLPMFHYHQTSPESMFTRQRLCTLARADGRVTLRGQRLTITRDGVRQSRDVAEDEVEPLLGEWFGLKV